MREEAAKLAPDVVYVDTYQLFSDPTAATRATLPDANGNEIVQMRISDGMHFTVDGAQYLADAVCKLLDKRWHITKQADPSHPIDYTIAPGSNDYVPGVGRYRPRRSSYALVVARRPYESSATADTVAERDADHGGTDASTTTPPTTDRDRRPPTHADDARDHAADTHRRRRRRTRRRRPDAAGTRSRLVGAAARVSVRGCLNELARRVRGRRSRRRPSSTPRSRTSPSSRATTASCRSPSSTSTRWSRTTSRTRPRRSKGSRVMCRYGEHGEVESMLARAYVADAVARHRDARRSAASAAWGVEPDALAAAMPFVAAHRAPGVPRGARRPVREARHRARPTSSDDFELVAETFRRFADDKIRPAAEHVHRTNADVPEEIISGLAELGGFGLSVPEEYDGFATGGESDYMGMVVATEELSRGSLGIGGSLVDPARDPHPGARRGRHRGAEADVAAAHRERRADGRHHGDRARLRLRRRRREGRRDARPTAAGS